MFPESGQAILDFSLHYALPGEVQTVPRGETHVLLLVTVMLQNKAKAVQYTDSLLVYNNYNKGKAHALASANKDLWEQFFENVQCKELDLSVKWLPSHLKDNPNKPKSTPTPQWVTGYGLAHKGQQPGRWAGSRSCTGVSIG